ncbi:hypothetical protein P873_05705 [Arenimonas composti TR7-09 = DSM 18010]|uniref:TonB-dependent receptor plug domain-containing protein n=2 Tax=Arenimonas TaxID=490567 RepID=A0A091C1Y6_9GAMM|nr:hypothetical protein P873_05705 [Arenimonas composti TR7-09 = DSM 18010]
MAGLLAAPGAATADTGRDALDDLLERSLEDLADVEVTGGSRRAHRLEDSAASVFVIHRDDLRRHGIRSLPEALRLAPNLAVARLHASGYAVSARGMKTELGNKLLVLIDGRPVYTPLFGGVLWDMQAVPVEEIERIEVVSGPGAAAWGANAVNGVINIVTRPAIETAGGWANAWASGEEHGAGVGQVFGDDTAALRIYARHRRVDDGAAAGGGELADGWRQQQVGFRADRVRGADEFTLQGDALRAESSPRVFGAVESRAWNLSAHWRHRRDDGSRWNLHGYLDVVDRDDPLVIRDRMRIAALEFVHESQRGAHRLTWGAGLRVAHDDSSPGLLAQLDPGHRTLRWAHAFVADQIALGPRLSLDLDLRLDHNPWTGTEVLPSLRLGWRPPEGGLVWAALSRAVRAPSRFDRDFHFPAQPPYVIAGGAGFDSEVAIVSELGWRRRPTDWLALSLTVFHHRYEGLRGGEPGPGGAFVIANRVEGAVWGAEGWATVRLPRRWELAAGFLELRKDLRLMPGFPDPAAVRDQGNDPETQWLLRASVGVGERQRLAAFARYVGALPDPHVPSYVQVDARWSFVPGPRTEFGIGVRNLFDARHAEHQPVGGLGTPEFGRTVFVDLRLGW